MPIITKSKKTGGIKAVKRAISIPPALHEMVCETARTQHQSYSAVISAALDRFFERVRQAKIEQAYRSYFSDEATRKKHDALAEENWRIGMAGWPK